MGFDEYTKDQPLVDVKKADTKNNILIVAGVVVFFAIATAVMIYYMLTPAETRSEVHREVVEEPGGGS